MDQNITIEQFSNFNQKYFLQVPESNELTSGFGSQSSKISIDGESLDYSCDSLSIPQNSDYSKLSDKVFEKLESPSRNQSGKDQDIIAINKNHVTGPLKGSGKHDAGSRNNNCLSENHFYNLFQHHYHLMAHIHRCFLKQSQLHDSECCKQQTDGSARRKSSNQVKSNENCYFDENNCSLVSTNSSGFVDFNHVTDGFEEVFTEKLSCDSQYSSISAPFDNRNQKVKKENQKVGMLCPLCNYKFPSKRSNAKDEKDFSGNYSEQEDLNVTDCDYEESEDESEDTSKASRIHVYRDEIHPSRLLSTSINDSNVYLQHNRLNNSQSSTNHHRWPSFTKRAKNNNILTAVVRPRMKAHTDSSGYQHQGNTSGVNQNPQNTNSSSQRSNPDDSLENNNEVSEQNDNSAPDGNNHKSSGGNQKQDCDSISMNEILANQANNSDSATALSGAFTDQGTRTCCFCWCCCCSCSCMQMRPNADKKKGLTNAHGGQKKTDISQAEEKPVTYEEVQQWGESFDALMQNSSGQKVFREFLRSEYSDENIMFWLACEDLKQEVDSEIVEEKARLIYENYISILSPKEVSLDSRVREIINGNMIEPSPRTFDEAQLQIYTLMHRDSYPRFLNSKLYKELLQKSKCDSYQ